MTEDGIPEILAEQRLGHLVPGMRGLYTHVSHPMREQLKAVLQSRWEASLRARIAIHPRSPLPPLGRLMAQVQHLECSSAGRPSACYPQLGAPTGSR